MAKILCVLYDDPVNGHPTQYTRDSIPAITHYPDGQTVPDPHSIDFQPGELLGSVTGALGLKRYLEDLGKNLTDITSRPSVKAAGSNHATPTNDFNYFEVVFI